MIELAISIIILLWFLNRSSLLKGVKDHINMWSSSSVLSSSLEYSKDLSKQLKKASDREKILAKNLLEGDLDYSKVLQTSSKSEKSEKTESDKINELIDQLTDGE